jgi:hypothetical protein
MITSAPAQCTWRWVSRTPAAVMVPLPIVGTYGEPLAPKASRVAQVHRRDERARRFCQKFQHGAFVIAQAYHVVTSLILQDADTIDARLTIRFVVERTHARPNTQHH